MMRIPEWAVWLDVRRAPDGRAVRHRVLYGGRGGAKSWTIAYKLIESARRQPLRILCLREYQNSIRDSSKRLLEDIIERLGFGAGGDGFFSSSERAIRGANGSEIGFIGLNGKESTIKSFEGIDRVWVEEAASVSQASIDALIPTIRKPASEIWWSYNPRYPTDPVDRLFRGGEPPPGSVVVEVHARDNPWFPEVLARDMKYDRARDPDKYAHVWLGGYVQHREARVFTNWAVHAFTAPDGAVFRFGADWGFSTDPTVLVRCFIGRWEGAPGATAVVADPKGRTLFVDFEAYRVGCRIEDTPALFAGSDRQKPPRWSNPMIDPGVPGAATGAITADNARPETINYMRTRGFGIVGAKKGAGSVEDGIEFLKNFDIVVHPRARHLIDELTHYSWATDRQTGEILPRLAQTNNHVVDALRYALEGVRLAPSPAVFRSAAPRVSATIIPAPPPPGHPLHEIVTRAHSIRSAPSLRVGILDW